MGKKRPREILCTGQSQPNERLRGNGPVRQGKGERTKEGTHLAGGGYKNLHELHGAIGMEKVTWGGNDTRKGTPRDLPFGEEK